jgi:glycosyltransferase involved in cell wall biosynthesis
MGHTPPSKNSAQKRILWLHTQPEHYFNRMMDDLAAHTGYTVPGISFENVPPFEYIAAFAARGHGWYAENAPKSAPTVFLRAQPGAENRSPTFREQYHIDWRADLLSLNFDAAIVSGYAWRTQRELIEDCHRRGIPVAIWSDSNLRADRGRTLKERLRRRLKKLYLQRIIRNADHLMTANPLGVAYWRYYGAPRSKITVAPYYADYARIDTARLVPRAELFRRFNLPVESRMIFSAARLVDDKGLDLLIRAFVDGDFARRGWIYVIAGIGPLENALKTLAGPALGKSIHFIGFQQPADNLALMSQAELLALPSRFEPHGIVVAEALAAGTPVLASSVVGAAYDLVQQEKNGLIFKTEDLADLRRKLHLACDQPEPLHTFRQAARRSFEVWYRRTTPTITVPRVMQDLLSAKGR